MRPIRGTRVVVEIDGKHYFSHDGRPSLATYAEMIRVDRVGYEVYRFEANELVDPRIADTMSAFLSRLFEKYGVGKGKL